MSRHHLPSAQPNAEILRGWIKTTKDAILVFEATRAGIVPRVTRRFHDLEKRSIIQSGAILVFTEEESGIKRWTDPYLWSASRMQGNFLMYREREDEYTPDAASPYQCSAVPSADDVPERQADADLEHYILGSWNKGKGLKKNGLMKKTISMSIEGTTYHLVSYYYPSDVRSGMLQTPSAMPALASLDISSVIMKSLSQFRQPPVLGKAKRGRPTRSNSVRGPTKESRPTGLVLDTRSAPYPSPSRSSYPSPRAATLPHEQYLKSYSPTTPQSTFSAPAGNSWPQHAHSIPSSPESFVLPRPSPISPHEYDFSRHYRDDSASDTSSTASIGSLSREPQIRDDSPHSVYSRSQSVRTANVDIGWHDPPVTTPTSMYTLPIPALHPDLYIASSAVYDHPHASPHAPSPELLQSWRPVLEEARVLGGGAPSACPERVYASAGVGLDCPPLPTPYFAGPMYH